MHFILGYFVFSRAMLCINVSTFLWDNNLPTKITSEREVAGVILSSSAIEIPLGTTVILCWGTFSFVVSSLAVCSDTAVNLSGSIEVIFSIKAANTPDGPIYFIQYEAPHTSFQITCSFFLLRRATNFVLKSTKCGI